MVFKFMTGKLSISDIENRVKELFDIVGKAMICSYAEIGMDVDKEADVVIAERLLPTFSSDVQCKVKIKQVIFGYHITAKVPSVSLRICKAK